MFPPHCLVPRAQEEACQHKLWLVVQYHTGHEDTHTPAAPTPTEGGETSRGWMSWREQAWGLPRGGPCHPEGGRDGHTRASTAHSMTETPTWGQLLHSYSAIHRAPDHIFNTVYCHPVLHLPHSAQLPALWEEVRDDKTTIESETSSPTSLRSLRLDRLQMGRCAPPATRT